MEEVQLEEVREGGDQVDLEEITIQKDAWREAYEKLMNKSIITFYALLTSKSWKLIESPSSSSVLLFESNKNTSQGFYTLKTQTVLKVRPERLMYVIRDHNSDTRLAWDGEYVKECQELDCFQTKDGEIKVVSTLIETGIPMLSPRFQMGIAWYGYDPKTESYKYVFRSTQHKMHKCPDDAVNVVSLIGVLVKTLRCEEKRISELFIVAHINPGNNFPSAIAHGFCKEWLRDRVALYNKVAGEGWSKYYEKKK
jgi:hypothetical protein